MSKKINDPIHGSMYFSPEIIGVIDTPQFQRLRNLRQLGTSSFVFPGVVHNRFEHSLGVSCIANKLVQRLDNRITDQEIKLVSIAGLCHDIGHGPFSHVFEEWINSKMEWDHEEMSIKMFEYLIDDNHIDFEREEIKTIQDLITGSRHSSLFSEKKYLYEIVHNTVNGIDVDKFDYLSRDSYYLGKSYDFNRLIDSMKIINSEKIGYHHKDIYGIYDFFGTRYRLHKQVYRHKVVSAIDYMVHDIFKEADSTLNLSNIAVNPEEFLYLNDGILSEIAKSKDPGLERSKNIYRRLEKRDLYKMVDEIIIPPDRIENISEYLSINKLIQYSISGNNLSPEDLIISHFKLNYSMGNQNPVLSVPFYSEKNQTIRTFIPSNEVSLLLPNRFEEHYCRLFVRNSNKLSAAKEMFNNYCRELSL